MESMQISRSTKSIEGIRDFFPFLYKLYMITNKENHPFIFWCENGTCVQLEYMGVQDYLISKSSIFHEKSMLQFTEQLLKYKFRKRQYVGTSSAPNIWLQFEHECFQRGRLELIEQILGSQQLYEYVPVIRKYDYEGEIRCIGEASAANHERKRERGDICSLISGTMSRVEQTRLRVQMHLQFQREQRALRKKIAKAEFISVKNVEQKGSRILTQVVNEPIIELPENKFESPLDTVLKFEEGYNPEFAGFYGITDMEEIQEFFGDYLPKHEGKRIVIEAQRKKEIQQSCGDAGSLSGDGDAFSTGDGTGEFPEELSDNESGVMERPKTAQATKARDSNSTAMKISGTATKTSETIEDEIELAMNSLCGESDSLEEMLRKVHGMDEVENEEPKVKESQLTDDLSFLNEAE